MKRSTWLGAFALLAVAAGSANAGYAQLAPPAGWSQGAGGASLYQAANGEKWLQSTVRTNAALNVGGRSVQVGAAMRLASNAPQYVAGRLVAGAAGGPGGLVAAGLSVAAMMAIPLVADWLLDAPEPLRWNPATQSFEIEKTTETGGWFWGGKGPANSAFDALKLGLPVGTDMTIISCSGHPVATCVKYAGQWNQEYVGAPEYVGDRHKEWQPVPEADVPSVLQTAGLAPLPYDFPNQVPMPLPVQNPVLNPSPGANPVHQPLTIPTADPVPVPNSNPQQWTQPVARVTPSPTPSNPWRVDVRDEQVIKDSPDPLPDPDPNPDSPPAEEDSATDTPLGEIPKLYDRKYPDGIKGVWDSKIASIKGSPLFSLSGSLTPNLGDGGCPAWVLNVDLGVVDYGQIDVSLPCNIWAFIRVCIIITALFLARRLIFGG